MIGKKILVAVHDPDHSSLLTAELEIEDIEREVVLVKDGQKVIEFFKKTDSNIGYGEVRDQISLVLLDLNLPKVHSMDILKFLKKNSKYCSIPVIISSINYDRKTALEAYKNGADDFITKPASFKEFTENMNLLKKHILNTN